MFNCFLAYVYFCGGVALVQAYNELYNSEESSKIYGFVDSLSYELNIDLRIIMSLLLLTAVMTGWILVPVYTFLKIKDYLKSTKKEDASIVDSEIVEEDVQVEAKEDNCR